MKRLTAFLLALAAVFALALALWSPARVSTAQREETDEADEWVGYFFSFEPLEERAWAVETADGGYDFGVTGIPFFLTITAITPEEAGYEEGSPYNSIIGEALGEGVTSGGMNIHSGDDGERYEIDGTITFSRKDAPALLVSEVYRTAAGEYYAEYTGSGYFGEGVGLGGERSVSRRVNGEMRARVISVRVSFETGCACEEAVFLWLDAEKRILAREVFSAEAMPEEVKAPEGAALLILTEKRSATDGTLTARTAFTAEEMIATLYVAAESEGLLNARYVSLIWEA